MQRGMRVAQTVILAAGSGSRLASARGDVPKPLVTIGGVPLIEHAIAHAHAAGCVEAVIVIGHEGERVRAAVEDSRPPIRVQFLYSPDPSLPNGISLLAAEPLTQDLFFLQMVDHLFADVALTRLTQAPFEPFEAGRVLIDMKPAPHLDLDDATKVRLDGRRVSAIGKGLDAWDAIDAGCFLLTPAIFEALRSTATLETRTVSAGMRELVAAGRLTAADLDGIEWTDIDTPADRDTAERLLNAVTSRTGA
ncbi:MAG: NTP transferase domain-containing protein [Vicinamibacterales bacterium]